MAIIALGLFILGGFICCLNFYHSFLRYLIHRMSGGNKDNYKWVSGFPLIGSLFVAILLLRYSHNTWIFVIAIILIAIDTGGIHWFLGTTLYHVVVKKIDDLSCRSSALLK
jgi:hypothetical protein